MKQDVYEDIIERAIQGEIEAAQFYANVAAKTADAYLKGLFTTFSKEEQRHRQILESFRDDPSASITFEKVPDFHISETVDQPALSMDMKPADAIALAMKKEEQAMKHYNELADACTNPDRKKLFLELAAMEREHKAKMETAFVDIGYPEVWFFTQKAKPDFTFILTSDKATAEQQRRNASSAFPLNSSRPSGLL